MSSLGQFRCDADYLSPGWLALKEAAIQRGEGLCEYCGLPLGEASHLHHRWYPRDSPDGLLNLMILHPDCHTAIHFGKSIPAKAGSLARQGDKGKGNSTGWQSYIRHAA